MQWARVRSLVGTSFLGEVFFGVFPHLLDKCQEALDPQGPRISFAVIIIITHHSLRVPMTKMLMRPKTSNIHTSDLVTLHSRIVAVVQTVDFAMLQRVWMKLEYCLVIVRPTITLRDE